MEEDLAMLKRAEEILRTLAGGVNPFTAEVISDDSVINEPKMIRCLNFTSEVLQKLIACGGRIKRAKKEKLVWNSTFSKNIKPSTQNLALSQFCRYIADETKVPNAKLSYNDVTPWLIKAGLLETIDGKKKATNLGNEHGILNTKNVNRFGKYYEGVSYSPRAQQYLIDNMAEILEYAEKIGRA